MILLKLNKACSKLVSIDTASPIVKLWDGSGVISYNNLRRYRILLQNEFLKVCPSVKTDRSNKK